MKMSVIALVVSFATLLGVLSCDAGTNAAVRILVQPFMTAESFDARLKGLKGVDTEAVALGRKRMHSRLARPGRSFVCTESASNATHRLAVTVSSLRSSENEFDGPTYGHSTKTTLWALDVIFEICSGDVIVLSKSVTSTYEERRPISESRFDNNVFYNLMMSAIEQAADKVVDFFDGARDASVASKPMLAPSASFDGGVVPAMAADRAPTDLRLPLAILKPEAGEGVSDTEAMLLWDILESKARDSAFRIMSRSDLSRMQEEIGFTTSSDLVNLSSANRARIGKIKTVSKLMATSFGKIGETYVLAFKVFDASTAEIETGRSRTIEASSLDALLPRLSSTLSEVLAAPPSGVVVSSVAAASASMPKTVVAAFDAELKQALAGSGVSVKSGSDGRFRIVPSVTVYSVRTVSGDGGFVYRGTIVGSVSVEGVDVPPVAFAVEDVELGREHGAAPSWLTENYGKKLVSRALAAESVRKWLSALNNQK